MQTGINLYFYFIISGIQPKEILPFTLKHFLYQIRNYKPIKP